MPKMSRPIQILLPPWLDDWITLFAERYNIPKATVMRNYLASGILMWSVCIAKDTSCPIIEKLTDKSVELKEQIITGRLGQEDLELLTAELAFEAQLATREQMKKIK